MHWHNVCHKIPSRKENKMTSKKDHIRHCLQYEHYKAVTSAIACCSICQAYAGDAMELNQMTNTDLYCQQLNRLGARRTSKRPALINRRGVHLHHFKVRPHVALRTRQKFLDLDWKILPHLSYSPIIKLRFIPFFLIDAHRFLSPKLQWTYCTEPTTIITYYDTILILKQKSFICVGFT